MKTILVTGASGNLGSAVVRKSLERGFRVLTLQNVAGSGGGDAPGRIREYTVDLTDEAGVKEVFGNIYRHHSGIDMAVLTVGGFAMGGLIETGPEELAAMYRLNFLTAYNVARQLYSGMDRQKVGGQMVFVGTRPALHPEMARNMIAYSLSKSLLFRLAEVINVEGKYRGISASVVVPGTMDTPQNRTAMPEADFSKWVRPEEVADRILHLSTPDGKRFRGTVIEVFRDS